jgi:hypothetical protein
MRQNMTAISREPDTESYWEMTRRPFPSLFVVGPLMIVYELGVAALGGDAPERIRSGADAWLRQALAGAGFTDRWLPPILLAVVLLVWQFRASAPWRISAKVVAGMVAESLVLAVSLVGLSRLIEVGCDALEASPPGSLGLAIDGLPASAGPLVGYLGAGVYEEALFRLAMVPLAFSVLRLLQAPQVIASSLAVTGSALLFSLAHHAGAPGEVFTWYAFVFRWMAGVFFAWVFVLRGFGIAVGTHTAYDILVGWFGWRI